MFERLSAGFTGELMGVAFIAIALLYMYLGKRLSDAVAGYNANHAIEEDSNLAVALRRAGFYLAIPLGMYGAISGPSQGFLKDLQYLAIDGAVIVAFLFIARWVNDTFVIHGIRNTAAVRNGNVAVGLVEFGGYIATGFIAMASFSGVGGGLQSAIVFFVLGQLVLVAATRAYEALTSWSVIQDIRDGNAAAGLMLGGVMVAISIAIFGAIAGNFTGWASDLMYFVVHAAVAIVLLLVAAKVIEPFFLPGTSIRMEIERDRNVAAIAVVVAVKIGVALMINAAVV